MLYNETVGATTLALLKNLLSIELFTDLRLVGGTSLALQIGHRKSIDLHLFGSIDIEALEINNALNRVGHITQLNDSKNIHIYLVNGIKVDIVNYTYPWLQFPQEENELRLSGLKDIAAMKLSAITGRGTKKDFIDLYFLLQHFSLAEMINFYLQKYADGSLFLVVKSLVYFEDAEQDVMPFMLIPVKWEIVKKEIEEVHKIFLRDGN